MLSGVADSGAFQNRCIYIYIYGDHVTDHVTQIAHRWTLPNYVTTEGNWLQKIIFRDFIVKGVNTYSMHTLLSVFLFFLFHFTNLDYFVFVHYRKSK